MFKIGLLNETLSVYLHESCYQGLMKLYRIEPKTVGTIFIELSSNKLNLKCRLCCLAGAKTSKRHGRLRIKKC